MRAQRSAAIASYLLQIIWWLKVKKDFLGGSEGGFYEHLQAVQVSTLSVETGLKSLFC